jgi:hypothetical protein
MTRVSVVVLFLAVFAGVGFFCSVQTEGFFPYQIPKSAPFQSQWEVVSSEEANKALLRQICAQPFSYLSKGDQCFVFASQDHQYVIKLPYHGKCLAPFWLRPWPYIAEAYRARQMEKKQRNIHKSAMGYLFAFEKCKEETGLLYLHLNRTTDLRCQIRVQDKIGVQHLIDLDTVEFMLQRKGILLHAAIERWMQQGNKEAAQRGLSALVTLFFQRYAKGFEDKEQCLEKNYGFVGEVPIQIDVGRLRKCAVQGRQEQVEAVRRTFSPFSQWLEEHYPELHDDLERQIGHCGAVVGP